MHSLQIVVKNLSLEGVRAVFQVREIGACARSRMKEVFQESRDFCFQNTVMDNKHVIQCRKNTNHGSTKLALIFSRIEQKHARLHIKTANNRMF